MTGKSENGMPMISVMGTLPGYIYCMLLSNMLVDMPLFGGALYLCGHAVIVFASVFGKGTGPTCRVIPGSGLLHCWQC